MAGLIDQLRGFLPARQPARPFSEQGVGGFIVVGGVVVQNETNSALLGSNRFRTAADLLSNISIIAASLRYSLNLVARPAWRCDPPNDKPEAKAAAEFMQNVLDDIGTNWTRIIRRAAMYRFHGYGLSEWVTKRRDDGRIGIAAIEQRPQHTIERWDIDLNGGVQGVWQRDPNNSGREIYLPRQKLIYLVDDTLTDRPDGMGWFRHVVEPSQRLKTYLKLESLGFQRDLTGIPIGRAPIQKINQLIKDGKITQAQGDQMIEGLKEFCRLEMKSEHTGMVLDSTTYRGKTEQGDQISQVPEWGMELLTGSQSSIVALGEAIRRIEFEIALIMGTSSMLTGREGQGSRALSQDQSRNLYLTVNATLDDMAESFTRDVVDPIWAMNGLSDDIKPKLKHEDASFKDVSAVAKALSDMATAGAIMAPDDPAINDLRNLMGISEAEPMDAETLALMRGTPTGQPDDGTGDQTGTGGGGGKPPPKNGQGRAVKFDPSQPRDQIGRWVGLGFRGTPEPETKPKLRDFPGVYMSRDPNDAAQYGDHITQYYVNGDRRFLDLNDTTEGSMGHQLVSGYAEQKLGEKLSGPEIDELAADLHMMPQNNPGWPEYLAEHNQDGTLFGRDVFVLDPKTMHAQGKPKPVERE